MASFFNNVKSIKERQRLGDELDFYTLTFNNNATKYESQISDLNGGELTGDRDTKRIPFALNDETGAAFTQAVWDEDDLRLGFDDAERIVEQRLSVDIAEDVWDRAQAGAYTGRITFTAELR